MGHRGAWRWACVLGAGCAQPVDPASLGYDLAAAGAWQAAADEALGEAVSPLTAVDVFYLAPGQSLTLGVVDGKPVAAPDRPRADDGVRVVVTAESDGVRIEPPDAAGSRSPQARVVPLGAYALAVGPQAGGARVVVHDPAAPARAGFAHRPWFPADAAFIAVARWTPAPSERTVELPTTRGLVKSLPHAGELSLRVGGESVRLQAFAAAPGTVMVPFSDPTNGEESYVVGRYVDVSVPLEVPEAGADVVVDFNRATNPWCAYSDCYNCPIPPRDNAVPVAVRAGERAPVAH